MLELVGVVTGKTSEYTEKFGTICCLCMKHVSILHICEKYIRD